MTGLVKVFPVPVSVCELCLKDRTDGRDEECHTPGCAFWMDDAPDGRLLTFLRAWCGR